MRIATRPSNPQIVHFPASASICRSRMSLRCPIRQSGRCLIPFPGNKLCTYQPGRISAECFVGTSVNSACCWQRSSGPSFTSPQESRAEPLQRRALQHTARVHIRQRALRPSHQPCQCVHTLLSDERPLISPSVMGLIVLEPHCAAMEHCRPSFISLFRDFGHFCSSIRTQLKKKTPRECRWK